MITHRLNRVQSLNFQGLPAFLSLIHREDKKMQHRIENLSFLAAGIAVFYALNQHLIGHGTAYACQSITSQQNNFVAEIGIMAFMSLAVFGGYYCWKTAPIFSVFAALILIIGLGYLQNRAQFDDFNFTEAKVERVYGS